MRLSYMQKIMDMLDSGVPRTPRTADRDGEGLHHEVRQSPSLICHRAYIRMRLRFELGIFLLALRVDANLTDSKVMCRDTYSRLRDVQRLLCYPPGQHNLEQRIPGTV
jgi:hypothetical protein